MIEAILFDVGGVLLENKGPELYQNLSKELGIDSSDLTELGSRHGYALRTGECSARDFARIIGEEFEVNLEIYGIWKRICERQQMDYELLPIVEGLHNHYRLGIISNTNSLYANSFKKREICPYFEIIVNSCEVGFVKPQKEIFEIALDKLGLMPQECVSIDDVEEFVEVAKDIGFEAILYKDYKQLAKELKQLGLRF
jgi:putative hydrolase of the HAD superfamily